MELKKKAQANQKKVCRKHLMYKIIFVLNKNIISIVLYLSQLAFSK